jgi:hypothetical protein
MISNLSERKIKQNKTNNATRNVNKVCLAFTFLKKSFLLTLNSLTLNKKWIWSTPPIRTSRTFSCWKQYRSQEPLGRSVYSSF